MKIKAGMKVRISENPVNSKRRLLIVSEMKQYIGTTQTVTRLHTSNGAIIRGFIWDLDDLKPIEIKEVKIEPITFNPQNLVT